jgi:hypothetical protein
MNIGEDAGNAFKGATGWMGDADAWNPFSKKSTGPRGKKAPLPDQPRVPIEKEEGPVKKKISRFPAEPEEMRAAQIRTELKEQGIDYSDCFDKESLVEKLKWARTADLRN